ncbi:efflux RND transporter periplasmic adaptor subunit [Marinomonas pollencensis]|uniref:RND family efflux transporter MFP subunit n=1 Tax=Marinomonas pollencensis TaxID=491954 RepID=A0A3E0DTG2_9GAMM|nr:efflux RND transporter periplasmic adaptor subunit [Marinomonas pollencensis]REG86832.1 RND family efflux transporter MFP subunit [Marinomonas pollencensis]
MKRLYQWITLALALLVIASVYLYISKALEAQKNKVRQPRPAAPEQAMDVTVIRVLPAQHAAMIQVSGVAEPHYALTLTSQVSGKVVELAETFEKGQRVNQGQLLATLHNTDLTSTLATAKNTLANAVLSLKEEERQEQQSIAEWKAAGFSGQPDSDLVLRKPQLAAAKAQLAAAKAALADAEDDVRNTQIRAPFDALIVTRLIAPGSYLSAGSEVATLYSTDRVEVNLDLAHSDWQKLPDANELIKQRWPAQITSMDGRQQWRGSVLAVDMHIDDTTRMRRLVVSLERPLEQSPPLLPGAFVNIKLQGKPIDNLWQLPNSALSQKSEIWYISDDQRLATFAATPRFVDEKYVYIDVPEQMRDKAYQVLTHPYNSYLPGSLVNPQENQNNASEGTTP